MADSIRDRIRKPQGKYEQIRAVIQGKGGAGKTTLLRTMPYFGRGLVLDIEGIEDGTAVLADVADEIDVFDCKNWADVNRAYHDLRRDAGKTWKWVAVDTATSFGIVAKRRILKLRDDEDVKEHQLRLKDYGDMKELQGSMFLSFYQLPIHVIFLVQERLRDSEDEDDEDGGGSEWLPDLTPRTAVNYLTPSADLVARLFLDSDDERRLMVGTRAKGRTKNRSLPGRPLPSIIVKPNLARIIRYMMGEDVKSPKAASASADL